MYNQQGRNARAARLREARLANEDPNAVGIKDFVELFIRHAKDRVFFGTSLELAQGAGASFSSEFNFNGDAAVSAAYAKGYKVDASVVMGVTAFSSGEPLIGMIQTNEGCLFACLSFSWDHNKNWAVDISIHLGFSVGYNSTIGYRKPTGNILGN